MRGCSLGFVTSLYSATYESRKTLNASVDVVNKAGFKGGLGGPGPRYPTNRGPPTKPFIFFSFVICVRAFTVSHLVTPSELGRRPPTS